MAKQNPPRNACKMVTLERHELTLETVRFQPGSTGAQICRLLLARFEQNAASWPQFHYADPKHPKAPYYAGTMQHLEQMEKKGWVIGNGGGAKGKMKVWVPTEKRGVRKRVHEVRKLKDEGLTHREVAAKLGVSVSLVGSLTQDPYGDRERERKKRYCPACGTKKDERADSCPKCRANGVQPEDLLPHERHLEIARTFERDTGCALVFGVTPGLTRVIRIDAGRGTIDHHIPNDLSWEEGIEEWLTRNNL